MTGSRAAGEINQLKAPHIHIQPHKKKRKKIKGRVFIGCPETVSDQTPTTKRATVIQWSENPLWLYPKVMTFSSLPADSPEQEWEQKTHSGQIRPLYRPV